jgi:3-phenylpropionate/cinnamic acid dioxygenase small subunit
MSVEEVLYITDELYEDVQSFFHLNHERGDPSELDPDAAVRVLYREARLLDAGRYEEWLSMFSPYCVYWVPGQAVVGDPREEPSIHFDDHRRLGDRIALIRTGFQHAQRPPSRTTRIVTNVEAWRDEPACMDVQSCVLIEEYRKGLRQSFVGRQLHRLVADDTGWRILYRIVMLLDRDADQGNNTFIL